MTTDGKKSEKIDDRQIERTPDYSSPTPPRKPPSEPPVKPAPKPEPKKGK